MIQFVKTGEQSKIYVVLSENTFVRYIGDTLNYEGNIMADNLLSDASKILTVIYTVK